MIKHKLTILAATLTLYGCVSPYQNLDKNIKIIDYPPLGVVTEASLGEHLLDKGVVSTEKTLVINNTVKGALWTLSEGDYRPIGIKQGRLHFNAFGKAIHNFGGMAETLSVNENNSKVCVHVTMTKTHCYDADYEVIDKEIVSNTSFRQTLIYTGKIGNKVNISYREFTSNLARPAFNSEIEYDLSESNEIAYKRALLEIIEADNRKIKYKVIRSFD